MDVIAYINLITSNTFTDWLRCHNDILYNSSYDEQMPDEKIDDISIRIICHLLKTLYNDKIPNLNKYYLLISIEEHLIYFIKTESGAMYMVQSLITDIKNRLNSRWDHNYMCQLLTLTCSITVHYNLPLSTINKSQSLAEGLINQLMDIIISENNTQSWIYLKHTALCSLLHMESCYPTILVKNKSKFADMVQNEKSINFELLLQIYSLIFKNDVINKCRQQQEKARLAIGDTSSLNSKLYNKEEIISFLSWISKEDLQENLIGSQSMIFKSLIDMIRDASNYLTPLGIRVVVRNCLDIASYLCQQNSSIWNTFISRFIRSNDINILEIFMLLKISSKSEIFSKPILRDEILQETLFAIVNNSLNALSKRLVAAHWLVAYPYPKQPINYSNDMVTSDLYCSLLEPELTKSIFLRSSDGIELKYCKLMLMSNVIKTSNQSDCNSVLLFSSLKELIKNINYYEPGMYSNILFRVMFAIHSRHCDSVLIGDFENIFDNLVIKYPSILQNVVIYLNALDDMNSDANISPFSSRCLSQIAKLSNERLTSKMAQLSIETVKMHIQVLNCAINMSQLNLKSYLDVLINFIASCKLDLAINWLDKACLLILELCFNIIKTFGSSNYYRELILLLNEIRGELIDPDMEMKANFLYSLIVSLSCKKTKDLIINKKFGDIKEDDYQMIFSSLIDENAENSSLKLIRCSKSFTNEKSRFLYDNNITHYFDFLNENQFSVSFFAKLEPKLFSNFWESFLYGIEVEFEADSPGISIKPWIINFTQSVPKNSFFIESELHITISKAISFTISGRLSATKLDGMFAFCGIEGDFFELFELGLIIPVQFINDDNKLRFSDELIKNRLTNTTFVSINFHCKKNYERFTSHLKDFIFVNDKELQYYIIFLPPYNHVVIKETTLSDFWRRFDLFSDLDLVDLVSIERYMKDII